MNEPRSSLRCEACGYPLSEILGTPGASRCPECATPIADSMPERRLGSPWQQQASVRGLLRTWWSAARHPIDSWRHVHTYRGRQDQLLVATCGGAALLGVLLPLVMIAALHASGLDDRPHALLGQVVAALVLGLLAWWILLAVSAITRGVVRLWGADARSRITQDVASVVVSHAAAGWLLGPSLLVVVLIDRILWWGVMSLFGRSTPHPLTPDLVMLGTTLLGAIASLLAFETLVYIGVRRMRFANAPRVAEPKQPTTTSGSAGA